MPADKIPKRRINALWGEFTLFNKTIAVSENVESSGFGWAKQALLLLNVTNADTDAGDTLDVYVDISPDDGVTWVNAVHFPQFLGTSAAAKHWFFLNPEHTGTVTIDVTTDVAVGNGRQIGLTDRVRVRAVVVDADADASFAFSVKAFVKG